MITNLPNFEIKANAPVSNICQEKGLNKFREAVHHVFQLPYKRNSSKEDLTLVFSEACGVCSTKHAAISQLALENDYMDLKLMIGIYKMNEENTPGVGEVLKKYDLSYMPEAHTYLIYNNERIDITREVTVDISPFESLLLEVEIQPSQIGQFKVEQHQSFLKSWIIENKISYSFEKIWMIREECIAALSEN